MILLVSIAHLDLFSCFLLSSFPPERQRWCFASDYEREPLCRCQWRVYWSHRLWNELQQRFLEKGIDRFAVRFVFFLILFCDAWLNSWSDEDVWPKLLVAPESVHCDYILGSPFHHHFAEPNESFAFYSRRWASHVLFDWYTIDSIIFVCVWTRPATTSSHHFVCVYVFYFLCNNYVQRQVCELD